ncbi:MAG: S8 family serine peptidase [Chitinophagaceae bacterium]|nr:S8 family serine peptidase [Chitinophagaceae bacterium]
MKITTLLMAPALLCLCGTTRLDAQKTDDPPQGWHLLDKKKDGYQGISLQAAYDFLKGKKTQTVVVAVMDGGTDTTHEDLKNKLWKNPAETAANGKDDDGNGLPDDVYGWNYLGNANGENIVKENLEAIRMYHRLKDEFENKTIVAEQLDAAGRQRYEVWQQVEKKLSVSAEDKLNYRLIKATEQSLVAQDSIIKAAWKKDRYTFAELEGFQPEDNQAKRARFSLLRTIQMLQMEPDMSNTDLLTDLKEYLEQQEGLLFGKEKPLNDYRKIVGDNPENMSLTAYGNKDIMGGDAKHGTHVAGIIAADRYNNKGAQGVADNVAILTLRVVPSGDEYDKDIALGIRYAVDKGAKIINMSFGKDVSPQQQWVEEAIRYAAQKDVLIVHAAGNDSKNLDENYNFPTSKMMDGSFAPNMITVAASSDESIKGGTVATFTNYGKTTVDVFAPGVKIYSPVPTTDKYAFLEGTSMAAPVVSGVAALIRGYYPSLTAAEVKQILMESADKSLADTEFTVPGTEKEKAPLSAMCVSGGIVNAANALMLAEKMALVSRW